MSLGEGGEHCPHSDLKQFIETELNATGSLRGLMKVRVCPMIVLFLQAMSPDCHFLC